MSKKSKNKNVLYVGIDMSLSSPGVAVCPYGDIMNRVDFWGLRQLVKYHRVGTFPLNEHTDLTLIDSLDRTLYDQCDRSVHVVESLMEYLEQKKAQYKCTEVVCFIEGYAFGAKSTSVSILCEIGGMLRLYLRKRGWHFLKYAPGTVKKQFSGFGVGKNVVQEAYLNFYKFPCVPAHVMTHFTPSKKPFEDIIDAVAVLYTGLRKTNSFLYPDKVLVPSDRKPKPKPKNRNKKRKREDVVDDIDE